VVTQQRLWRFRDLPLNSYATNPRQPLQLVSSSDSGFAPLRRPAVFGFGPRRTMEKHFGYLNLPFTASLNNPINNLLLCMATDMRGASMLEAQPPTIIPDCVTKFVVVPILMDVALFFDKFIAFLFLVVMEEQMMSTETSA
jgi:hypothetical protein